MKISNLFKTAFILVILMNFAGCTIIFQKGRRSDIEKINALSQEIDRLSMAKSILEEKLQKEIAGKEVTLSMQEKGLVVTFLSEVLFDSGKADIKSSAFGSLDKVADVLLNSVAGMNVGVEGHTDNQPIKFSKWESNWDLSGARARNVLKHFVKKGVSPERLSFIGYGEYKPVASNGTKEGRQKNRRVEIVILPTITKDKKAEEPKTLIEPKENLK